MLIGNKFENRTFDRALSINHSAYEDSLLNDVQDCIKAKAAWQKPREKYASTLMVYKQNEWNAVMSPKYTFNENMCNQVAMLSSQI